MATVLDVTLLSFLMPFFVFFFVFALMFALLSKTKLFGEKSASLNFVAAVCVSAISVFTGSITGVIVNIVPWLVFIIVILLLLFGMFMFFGVSEKETWDYIGGQTLIYVIIILVVFVGLIKTFQTDLNPYQPGTVSAPSDTAQGQPANVQGAVVSTLVHPRVLGALFILIVSGLSIRLLLDKV